MIGTARLGMLALACAGFTTTLHAASYPERPIRLIVPFSPGGTSDLVARVVGNKLGDELGQTIIVDGGLMVGRY